MIKLVFRAWILVLAIVSCGAIRYHELLPDNYVLDAETVCSPTPVGVIEVRVITDLNVAIEITCKNNYTEKITSHDGVQFYFYPAFSGDSASKCVFMKPASSHIYTVMILASFGEPESKIRPVREKLLVTCTYDDYSHNATKIERIGDSLIAPTEIQHHHGDSTSSTITLRMVDVLGKVITGKIPRGKLVKLKAVSDGAGGEQGLSATSCDGVSDDGVRYAVLRAGCGDGIIFGRSEGFITQGLDLSSPYFAAFNIKGGDSMKFHCNFTLCSTNCDGGSCRIDVNIEKRSADGKNVTVGKTQEVSSVYIGPILESKELGVDYRHIHRPVGTRKSWWHASLVVLMVTTILLTALAGTALIVRRRMVGAPMF